MSESTSAISSRVDKEIDLLLNKTSEFNDSRSNTIKKMKLAIDNMSLDPDNDTATKTMAKVSLLKTYSDMMKDVTNDNRDNIKLIQKQAEEDNNTTAALGEFIKQLASRTFNTRQDVTPISDTDAEARCTSSEDELDKVISDNNLTILKGELSMDSKDVNIADILDLG